MPCYRCGTRQVDPDRGESPWRRGVRRDRQVLICPGCQGAFDWASDLDKCAVCGSVHLVRRLGEVECRDCGSVGQPVLAPGVVTDETDPDPGGRTAGTVGGAGGGAASGVGGSGTDGRSGADGGGSADGAGLSLAEEVELALSRVLGPSSSQRPPYAMS
jgi:hypothetical protein